MQGLPLNYFVSVDEPAFDVLAGNFMSLAFLKDQHSIELAEVALAQIKSHHQPAVPRNYEIWYTYTSGGKPALNRIVDDLVARNGALSESDCEQVFQSCLAPSDGGTFLDELGAAVDHQMAHFIDHIVSAVDNAAQFDVGLLNAVTSLSAATDGVSVKAIVINLIKATQRAEDANKDLEGRLRAARGEITELQQKVCAVRQDSMTDSLTGLTNRRQFDRDLSNLIEEAVAHRKPISLLMIDIDRFKSFNDNFGHAAGDQVLRLVAASLKQSIEGQDIAARYGGEEFVVVLPNTRLEQAVIVAEHIRRAIMAKELKKRSTGELLGRIAASIGVSQLSASDDKTSLIERADACLYAAKRTGRNKVVCERDLEYLSDPQARVGSV